MKILVLRGGALGDFLVTLPALNLLRARWPQARIELAGNARAAELALPGGTLDAVHSQHQARWAALFDPAPLPGALRGWLAEFDLVVNYWPDPEGELAAHFPLRAGQTFVTAPAMPALAPAARHYCEALRPLGCETTDYGTRLPFGKFEIRNSYRGRRPTVRQSEALSPDTGALKSETQDADRKTQNEFPVAIHPGSGSPRKNWPVGRWAELAAKLRGQAPLLIVGGETDTAAVAALAPCGEVAQNLPLPELARRLAACRLFLGHDSGVSHLAAAVGTPCVLLFGPTEPAMWAPPGEHVQTVRRGPELSAISVDAVWAAVTSRR
jgi:heptosyltransferase-3